MTHSTALSLVLLAAAGALAGCSHEGTLACGGNERYATATSIPPVQIPDDLTPPDESDSLRLPPVGADSSAATRPCLEAPPGANVSRAAADDSNEKRRRRDRKRDAATAAPSAEAPAGG